MSDPMKFRIREATIIEGISPEVTLEQQPNGVQMTVKDKTGTKTALIPKGDSYVLTEADKEQIADAAFESFEAAAEADVRIAEGWAKGTQDDVPVESGSPYYHDNAKYYSEQAADSADDADTAKTEAQTAAASASAAYGTSLLAPNFSTESTYAVGDYVIYSGNLYRCTTAVTTAGAWNNSSWTQVAVGGEVGALKSAISNIYEQTETLTMANSGGKVVKYQINAGRKYVIKNNTNGDVIPSTRLTENGDAVETFSTIHRDDSLVITPSYDANYFRVYFGSAGNVTISAEYVIKNIEQSIDHIEDVLPNIILTPILEKGTAAASDGTENYSSVAVRTKILPIKSGSKISKTNAAFTVTAFYYSSYDEGSFINKETIISANVADEFVFDNNKYVRFVFSTGSVITPQTIIQNTSMDLYSFDKNIYDYIDVLFYGNPSYLGNATAVKLDNSKTFMVDSFIADAYTDMKNNLRAFGVDHLDYFMLTHYHKDHAGNIQNLITDGYIDSSTVVFLPPDLDTSYQTAITWDWLDNDGPVAIYQQMKQAIVSSGATIVNPTEQMVYNVSDGCYLKFYNTDHSMFYPDGTYESQNFNDWSLGAYLWCGKENILFTGDLGPIGQQKMVDLGTMVKSNLYTATHHGWDNGNHSNFYGLIPLWINKVNPDVVISMDYNIHSTYIETISCPQQTWCEKNHVSNYRTALNGAMNFRVTKDRYIINGRYRPFIRNNIKNKDWYFYNYDRELVIDTRIKALATSLNAKEYIATTGNDLLYNAAVAFQGAGPAVDNTYDFRIRVIDSANADSFGEFLVSGYKRMVSAGSVICARTVNIKYKAMNSAGTFVVEGVSGTPYYVVELVKYTT